MPISNCSQCGVIVNDTAQVCPHCGTPIKVSNNRESNTPQVNTVYAAPINQGSSASVPQEQLQSKLEKLKTRYSRFRILKFMSLYITLGLVLIPSVIDIDSTNLLVVLLGTILVSALLCAIFLIIAEIMRSKIKKLEKKIQTE